MAFQHATPQAANVTGQPPFHHNGRAPICPVAPMIGSGPCHVSASWRVWFSRNANQEGTEGSEAAAGAMTASTRSNAKARNGSKSAGGVALDAVFAELRPAMFALAYRITGNRAEAEE